MKKVFEMMNKWFEEAAQEWENTPELAQTIIGFETIKTTI